MHYYTDVLKKYAVFQGRASRKEFWVFSLINFAIISIIAVTLNLLNQNSEDESILIYFGYIIAVICPTLAVTTRRLHDTGRSGSWILISLIPFIGSLTLTIFTLLESDPEENKYGPNPYTPQNLPKASTTS